MFLIFYYFVTLLCLTNSVNGLKRQLHQSFNPGCDADYCNQTTLVHITADGPNDTVHYIWSFIGKPTLLLAVTERDTNLLIDWQNLVFNLTENTIWFDKEPNFSFGVAFNRLLEFRDSNDTATLTMVPDKDIVSMNTENFAWSFEYLGFETDESLVLKVKASSYDDSFISRNGNLSFTISGYGEFGHSLHLPHLLHTANCTQVELILDGLEIYEEFEGKSRFALELFFASSEHPGGVGAKVTEHRSLDDEHTPGVFTVAELMSPLTRSGNLGAYVQWRPVAYTHPARDMETSTEVRYYPVSNITQPQLTFNNTLLLAFYGFVIDEHLTEAFNISFGVTEDGFYNASSYTVWSVSMGYGQPPEERLSLMVLLIMGIGLGVPALLLIVGGLYLALKQPVKKDDLLLSR